MVNTSPAKNALPTYVSGTCTQITVKDKITLFTYACTPILYKSDFA